jgi:hypothetical protein
VSSKSLTDLIQIVRNGGSLALKVSSHTTADLVQLVRNGTAKSTIILRGADARTTEDLVQISRNATGTVILDVD